MRWQKNETFTSILGQVDVFLLDKEFKNIITTIKGQKINENTIIGTFKKEKINYSGYIVNF